MSSLVWLGLTVLLVVVATLAGLDPKGGKPIARTRLMKTARLILIGGALACAGLALLGVFSRR